MPTATKNNWKTLNKLLKKSTVSSTTKSQRKSASHEEGFLKYPWFVNMIEK